MKTAWFAAAAVGAAALMYGGAMPAEGHNGAYFNGVIDVFDYSVVEYADFDLVRMTVQIENLQSGAKPHRLTLAIDDSFASTHVRYADVRGKGAEVSVNDCSSNGRAPHISTGGVANMTACFMVGSGTGHNPSALSVRFDGHGHWFSSYTRHGTGAAYPHIGSYIQIVPFHEESAFCFVDNSSICNANNIQRIDTAPAPQPEPEPEPPAPEPQEPEPATLLYTIYHNQTGVLTLVFDDLVVAHNPGRIHLIHDIDAFIEDEEPPGLDGAELNTVDNKRQSMMLAFALPDTMHLEVIESLRTHGDLALLVDTQAVYAAEGFVDITDGSPVLVPDIIVVR